MIQLTGLWENTDKNRNTYYSGNLGNAKLVIFKNTYKKEPKQPDYIIYLDEKEKKDADPKQEQNEQSEQSQAPNSYDDDLPF
jgi:hypothetical protein